MGRSVTESIREAIWQHCNGNLRPIEKISMSQSVWEQVLWECSPELMTYADKTPDTLFGIPIDVVPDSPNGYVCIGGDLRAVRYERLDD